LFEKPKTIACLTVGVAVAVFAAQSLPKAQTARESALGSAFVVGGLTSSSTKSLTVWRQNVLLKNLPLST
jgi:hypothetical protein